MLEKFSLTNVAPPFSFMPSYAWLFENAEKLFADEHHEAAVVTAASACEVVSEIAIAKAFALRNISDLEEPVCGLLSSYSISADRTRQLYVALTSDEISKKPFWPAFLKFIKCRQSIVHSGARVEVTDARNHLDAAKQFLAHIVHHNNLK